MVLLKGETLYRIMQRKRSVMISSETQSQPFSAYFQGRGLGGTAARI